MKKIFLLIIISFSLIQFLIAQTNVSGFINCSTTWTISGSPYIVTGNTLVSNGYTLTINPGVVIKFNIDKALQIDGQLIAIGTPSQRITFTSNQINPQPGDWANLHFSDFCTDAIFDSAGHYISGTIMKYCDIIYAGGMGNCAIDVEQSTPYFSHSKIFNSASYGVYFISSNAVIDSSLIKNCSGGIFLQTGDCIMYNDSIINSGIGIGLSGNYDGIKSKIINCYFDSNIIAISSQHSGIKISYNYFTNNNGTVIDLMGLYDTITCNKFINNQNGPAIHWGDYYNTYSAGLIFNNLFEGNINPTGPSVIECGSANIQNIDYTLIFANNIIRNNFSLSNSCCEFSVYTITNYPTKFLHIYNNLFTNNTGSNLIKFRTNSNSNATFDFLFMKNNTFSNPNCQYEIYNDIPYGLSNLYLGSNYWGSANTQHIDSVIYDYFDFANQTVVYYLPILTSPFVIDSTCRPFINDTTEAIGNVEMTEANLLIYPNPTTGEFSISSNVQNNLFKGKLEIFNTLSEKIYSTDVTNLPLNNINISLPKGIYFISLTTLNRHWTGKIIKE